MNSAGTDDNGISLFCLWADKCGMPKTGLPPNPILLSVDYLIVNDFPDSGLDFIHFLHPQHRIVCFQLLGNIFLRCDLLLQILLVTLSP